MDRLLTLFFFLETKGLLETYLYNITSNNDAHNIALAFSWRETEQGFGFWSVLYSEFNEWCEVGDYDLLH